MYYAEGGSSRDSTETAELQTSDKQVISLAVILTFMMNLSSGRQLVLEVYAVSLFFLVAMTRLVIVLILRNGMRSCNHCKVPAKQVEYSPNVNRHYQCSSFTFTDPIPRRKHSQVGCKTKAPTDHIRMEGTQNSTHPMQTVTRFSLVLIACFGGKRLRPWTEQTHNSIQTHASQHVVSAFSTFRHSPCMQMYTHHCTAFTVSHIPMLALSQAAADTETPPGELVMKCKHIHTSLVFCCSQF